MGEGLSLHAYFHFFLIIEKRFFTSGCAYSHIVNCIKLNFSSMSSLEGVAFCSFQVSYVENTSIEVEKPPTYCLCAADKYIYSLFLPSSMHHVITCLSICFFLIFFIYLVVDLHLTRKQKLCFFCHLSFISRSVGLICIKMQIGQLSPI